jgi:hypothetical protein
MGKVAGVNLTMLQMERVRVTVMSMGVVPRTKRTSLTITIIILFEGNYPFPFPMYYSFLKKCMYIERESGIMALPLITSREISQALIVEAPCPKRTFKWKRFYF